MGDVLDFPSQQAKGLAFLDRELRSLLATRGADEELINFTAEQLTRIYAELSESEQYRFSIGLPEGLDPDQKESLKEQINAGLEGIRKENHAIMLKLVARLVLAEVRAFQCERAE